MTAVVLPGELRDLVASGPLAHLTTLNADGSPQVSVIWIGLDGDDIVSGHLGGRVKPGFIVRYRIERISGIGPWA